MKAFARLAGQMGRKQPIRIEGIGRDAKQAHNDNGWQEAHTMTRYMTGCLAVLMLALGVGVGPAAKAQVKIEGDPKVAFIYVSPANDGGWSTSHERARQAVEAATGFPTAYTESVVEETSAVRQAIDAYVNRGFNIIVGSSFGFGDGFLEAAKDYPNVAMMNAAGVTEAPNLESFYPRTYQGWYLAGMVAGAVSTSGKIGMVAGFPVPVVNWDINGFARGAQAVKPDIEVIATFANTWYDPVKEAQAAAAMLEQGADVIATNLSAAIVLEAENKGKYSIGFQNDMSPAAPKGHLTAVVFNWENYLTPTIQTMVKGEWKSAGNAFVGIETGIVDLAPFNAVVPKDVQDNVLAAKQAMIDGKMTPFDGPVYRQDGTVAVEAGRAITDDELWSMQYLVKGTIGSMPAQ